VGAVVTPMAGAAGRPDALDVALCAPGSALGFQPLESEKPSRGRSQLIAHDAASGRELWTLRLRQPDFGCATAADGVVFTATFDGKVYAVGAEDGRVLWSASLRAGVNACPALAAGTLLVGAGVPTGRGARLELTAFRVGYPGSLTVR